MQKALQAQTFKYKLNLKCEAKKNDFQKKVGNHFLFNIQMVDRKR